ncbi:MAG: serine hydrolase [Fimbriimonadales bacterium]
MKAIEAKVDAIVKAAMDAFDAPGMAVAIVRDGKVVHCRGYGFRERGKPDPVTSKTNFAIASCTKAFTSTAAAMLVDEKKMAWDDPVRKHIPFFRFTDPVSDHLVTIADLLSHRTGLPRSDILWYGSRLEREEIVRRACNLGMAHPIRSFYEYNNLMYTAAGYAIGLASGLGYENFIRKRIFGPLGMTAAALSSAEAVAATDHATPHDLDRNRKTVVIPRCVIDNVCPTGGIHAGAEDMAKWLIFQLAGGMWMGKRLVSEENLAATKAPMILSDLADEPDLPTLSAYAMGWQVYDLIGTRVLTHSGGIDGFASETTLLPRLGVGFSILCNVGRPAPRAVRRALTAHFGGFGFSRDPVQRCLEEERKLIEDAEKASKELLAKKIEGTRPSKPFSAFAGKYSEPAYGEMEFSAKGKRLAMTYNGIRYDAEHLHHDTFLLHPPFVQVVESLGTLTFGCGHDGVIDAARWIVKGWDVDRVFRRM